MQEGGGGVKEAHLLCVVEGGFVLLLAVGLAMVRSTATYVDITALVKAKYEVIRSGKSSSWQSGPALPPMSGRVWAKYCTAVRAYCTAVHQRHLAKLTPIGRKIMY
jgi:hypothetical protein